MGKIIYLDYAATTPVDPKVLKAMLPYLKENYGNPSSIYELGQKSLLAIDKARGQVAGFLNCDQEQIVFTGSATEANNLAIQGAVKWQILNGKSQKLHIITTQIEHPAVFEPCKRLEEEGAEVTYLPVDKDGIVKLSELKKVLKSNTVLVSIMYANNEIGTIQPIREIAEIIRNFKKSKTGNSSDYPLFHTDAVQAANYLDCDVQKLGVDLLTLSAHKIYGPKGTGALFIRSGVKIAPQIFGGGQENGIRSGTENVAGIVGMGEAVKNLKSPAYRQGRQMSNLKKIESLCDALIEGILKNIPNSRLNGSRIKRLPNNINFSFRGVEGEAMVMALDQKGIAVSTGSACSSKSLEPSPVLMALGLSREEAHSSLRITLGRYTTKKDIDTLLKILPGIVSQLRKISGYLRN